MIDFKRFNLQDYSDCLIVTDEKIGGLYNIKGDSVYYLPQGEAAKAFVHVEQLCKWFLAHNLTRSGEVVAVGGGSVGDTAGFAACVYKRGVKLTHVPTTLVAQIDSSIGGKTAIDLEGVKNAVGTFYPADTVIDVDFLKTLPDDQMKNGQGELLKYRMLSGEIDKVAATGDIASIVKACADYKAMICKLDPYDNGARRTLNFGHTIGHALELSLGIPHGAAVANGIYYETALAHKLGKCDDNYLNKWTDEVTKRFVIYPLSAEILRLTVTDKKNSGNGVIFMLPDNFGVTELSVDEVIYLLQ